MMIIHEHELTELLKDGPCNLREVIKVLEKKLHYVEVLRSLLELKKITNVELVTKFDKQQVLQICIQEKEAFERQLELYPKHTPELGGVLVDAVNEFNHRHDTYAQQIYDQKCSHIDEKFTHALKSIAKLDEQSIRFCDVDVELPLVDPTLFKNIAIEPPLVGRGSANLMRFNEKIIFIKPERICGHNFKDIEVKLTKQQVHDLVDLSYESHLYGNYVLKRQGNSYELVSFEVINLTLDF